MPKRNRILDEARGRDCQIRLPCCNWNTETTVPAHLSGGGMGMKRSDFAVAWACSACHDAVDGRDGKMWDREWLKLCHLEGVIRTLETLDNEKKIRYVANPTHPA